MNLKTDGLISVRFFLDEYYFFPLFPVFLNETPKSILSNIHQ